eukprot:4604515-Prymnesium_polylepis.1
MKRSTAHRKRVYYADKAESGLSAVGNVPIRAAVTLLPTLLRWTEPKTILRLSDLCDGLVA